MMQLTENKKNKSVLDISLTVPLPRNHSISFALIASLTDVMEFLTQLQTKYRTFSICTLMLSPTGESYFPGIFPES